MAGAHAFNVSIGNRSREAPHGYPADTRDRAEPCTAKSGTLAAAARRANGQQPRFAEPAAMHQVMRLNAVLADELAAVAYARAWPVRACAACSHSRARRFHSRAMRARACAAGPRLRGRVAAAHGIAKAAQRAACNRSGAELCHARGARFCDVTNRPRTSRIDVRKRPRSTTPVTDCGCRPAGRARAPRPTIRQARPSVRCEAARAPLRCPSIRRSVRLRRTPPRRRRSSSAALIDQHDLKRVRSKSRVASG